MNGRQTRALVLLAGNGTVLLFLTQFFSDNLDWVLPPEGDDKGDSAPLLVFAAIGVIAGYMALTATSEDKKLLSGTYDWFESIASACFLIVVTQWVIYALYLGGYVENAKLDRAGDARLEHHEKQHMSAPSE